MFFCLLGANKSCFLMHFQLPLISLIPYCLIYSILIRSIYESCTYSVTNIWKSFSLHLNKTTLSSIPEFESICPHGRGSYNLGTASSPHYKRVSVIVFHFQI